MDFSGLTNYEFFVQLGYVTIISSILTMLITWIIKMILKKRKVIKEGMDPTEKDQILSKVGRIVALIIYTALYLGNEFYLKHTITLDGTLLTGLFSGATLTLTLAKGFYTMIRQYQKKKNVFEKLKYCEETIQKLQEPHVPNQPVEELITHVITSESKNRWILSNNNKEETK